MTLSFRSKVFILSTLMVALAALYLLGFLFNSQSSYSRALQTPLLPNFNTAMATRVKLVGSEKKEISLEKKGSHWYVAFEGNDFPASDVKVQTFLDSLANLKRGKVVSADSKLNHEFELDTASAKDITVTDGSGAVAVNILVGKTGASGFEDYVRLAEHNRVLLTRSSLSFYLSQDRSYWYDLAILPEEVTGASINEIKVSGAIPLGDSGRSFKRESYDLTLTQSRESSEWVVKGRSQKLDQRKTQIASNRLSLLQGVDFETTARAQSNDRDGLEVRVATVDHKQYSFHAVPLPNPAQYAVTTSELPFTFIVNTAALARAVVPLSSLIAP